MSVIFEGMEMPTACCFVDGEHSAFAHFEYCKFYNICEKRDTIKTNCKPSDCPVKALEQEPISFQWCTDCKEYDQEKHCCHRWSEVIRNTVEEMKQEQEPTTKNVLALLEKTYTDFCNSEGGEGWLKIDGKEYSTDAGYALEGMSIFMEVFKQRLADRSEEDGTVSN